jgi:hypothetical protein
MTSPPRIQFIPQVRVFFGDEAFAACQTVEACRAQLAKKSDEDITPFLQVCPPQPWHKSIGQQRLTNKIK